MVLALAVSPFQGSGSKFAICRPGPDGTRQGLFRPFGPVELSTSYAAAKCHVATLAIKLQLTIEFPARIMPPRGKAILNRVLKSGSKTCQLQLLNSWVTGFKGSDSNARRPEEDA
jgi:hypothetical protein